MKLSHNSQIWLQGSYRFPDLWKDIQGEIKGTQFVGAEGTWTNVLSSGVDTKQSKQM